MKNVFKKLGFTCLGVAACGTASSLITSTNAQQVVQTLAEAKVNEAIEANKSLINNVKDKLTTLKTEIDKNIYNFNYESSNGVRCAVATRPMLNQECKIEFVMPVGQTKVNDLKVLCGNQDITNKTTISYAACRTGYINIPKNVVNGDIKVTISSTKNTALNLNNDDPQTISLVNNPSYNDGSDLVLEYQVEEGQLFCAEAIGMRIGDENVSSSINCITQKSDKPGIWTVTIPADELSSITNLQIKTRNAIKVDSIFDIYENASLKAQLDKNNNDLEGWDWSKDQTSPYHRWIDEQYQKALKEVEKGNIQCDKDTLWNIRNWAYDNGKAFKTILDNETIRKNRVLYSEASKADHQLRNTIYVSPNTNQDVVGLVRKDSEGQKPELNISEFYKLDSKKDEMAGNVSYNASTNEIIVKSGKHKEGRYVYVPFKVELTTPLNANTVYNLFPSMNIHYSVYSNYRFGKGHDGNHFLTQLYYFGEGDEFKYSRPESFDSKFVENKDPAQWDKNVIWRQHFYKGGNHDTEKGSLDMGDKCANLTKTVCKDEHKTLYFGLYVAARSRSNKSGALGYDIKLTPSFTDKNSKLNVTEGEEIYQQSKRFERDCQSQNAIEEFYLRSNLGRDKAIAPEKIELGKTDITVKGTSKNMNLRGIYLPVNNVITLPAHTKAKVNVGLQATIGFQRKKSVNIHDTLIQDYSSFFNINKDVVNKYFEDAKTNDFAIPADDKYASVNKPDKIINSVLRGCEKFEQALAGAEVVTLVFAPLLLILSVGMMILCFTCGSPFAVIFLIATGALIYVFAREVAHNFNDCRIDTAKFLERKHDFYQSQVKDKIYEDIELVNDTDEEKSFTFDMAYGNVLEGEKHKEKPISAEYHISSAVKFTEFKKI